MTFAKFSRNALLVALGLVLLYFTASSFIDTSSYNQAGAASLIFMLIVVHISYYFIQQGMKSDTHAAFMRSIAVAFAIKMLSAIIFVFGFKEAMQPASNEFVIIFFGVYFVYTILLAFSAKKPSIPESEK